jgi:hypothetical protein
MLRRVMEDVAEMSVLAVFLASLWMWATALAPVAGV